LHFQAGVGRARVDPFRAHFDHAQSRARGRPFGIGRSIAVSDSDFGSSVIDIDALSRVGAD